jgi:hypothetical protein
MLRGRRSPSGLLTIVVSTAIEPQYVCGAATFSLRWHTEIQSEHAARGQPRRDEYSGKKGKNPLLGAVCLLTIGVLIRVRQHTSDHRERSDPICSPHPQRPPCPIDFCPAHWLKVIEEVGRHSPDRLRSG